MFSPVTSQTEAVRSLKVRNARTLGDHLKIGADVMESLPCSRPS